MIHELFSYKSKRDKNALEIAYFGCLLNKPMSMYRIGDDVAMIVVDYEKGLLHGYRDRFSEEKTFTLKLELRIVEHDEAT